jgi:Cu/Ag efflux protein CusF
MLCSGFSGCKPQGKAEEKASSEAAKDYPIEGQVAEIGKDRMAVTIDHKEIPNLMKAMKMEFTVEDASVLKGIDPGDSVQGRLKVEGGEYIITNLRKL